MKSNVHSDRLDNKYNFHWPMVSQEHTHEDNEDMKRVLTKVCSVNVPSAVHGVCHAKWAVKWTFR